MKQKEIKIIEDRLKELNRQKRNITMHTLTSEINRYHLSAKIDELAYLRQVFLAYYSESKRTQQSLDDVGGKQ